MGFFCNTFLDRKSSPSVENFFFFFLTSYLGSMSWKIKGGLFHFRPHYILNESSPDFICTFILPNFQRLKKGKKSPPFLSAQNKENPGKSKNKVRPPWVFIKEAFSPQNFQQSAVVSTPSSQRNSDVFYVIF